MLGKNIKNLPGINNRTKGMISGYVSRGRFVVSQSGSWPSTLRRLGLINPLIKPLGGSLDFHSSNYPNSNNNLQSSYSTATPQSHPPKFYSNRVLDTYASQESKRVTIRQLCVFGRNMSIEKLLKSANYLRQELPVRLSHRIRDFQSLPFIVGTNPHLERIYGLYWAAFEQLRKVPFINSLDENLEYCLLIKKLLMDHGVVIPLLAMGLAESSRYMSTRSVDRFMNEMLRSRISRRVLAEQHIRLSEQLALDGTVEEGWIGMVNTQISGSETVRKCATVVQDMFRAMYPQVPAIQVDGDLEVCFTYIPEHVEYIIVEMLKNSVKATVERHLSSSSSAPLPAIRVTIASSQHDITFRISDCGGGLPTNVASSPLPSSASLSLSSSQPSQSSTALPMPINHFSKPLTAPPPRDIFSFSRMHSPSIRQVPQFTLTTTDHDAGALLNLGLGLPMSKVYANYWGGTLGLVSMEGWGVDVYIKVGRLGTWEERLEY